MKNRARKIHQLMQELKSLSKPIWGYKAASLYMANNNKLKLPISSLNEEFTATCTAVTQQVLRPVPAESQLRHRTLVGPVTSGRAGLGSSTTPHYIKAKRKDRWVLVQDKVRSSLEELLTVAAVGKESVYDVLPSPSNGLLGEGGVTNLPSVSEERDPGVHPQKLFQSPGRGALPLAR